mmetsp:Transcript_13604/g.55034  ORF Transcript_13604/g.55034 Transcript_13604/m.55034 type:complete len:219 (+) Transcript_13604:53-709(+)
MYIAASAAAVPSRAPLPDLAANLPHDLLHPGLPLPRASVDEPIRNLPLRQSGFICERSLLLPRRHRLRPLLRGVKVVPEPALEHLGGLAAVLLPRGEVGAPRGVRSGDLLLRPAGARRPGWRLVRLMRLVRRLPAEEFPAEVASAEEELLAGEKAGRCLERRRRVPRELRERLRVRSAQSIGGGLLAGWIFGEKILVQTRRRIRRRLEDRTRRGIVEQ